MTDNPPPMPPQQAKKLERPRSVPILKPAIRIVTAMTTRHRLISVAPETQEVDNGG